MKLSIRVITVVFYIAFAIVFWIFEKIGWYSIEVIDKKYKYQARGASIVFIGFNFWWMCLSDGASFPIKWLRANAGQENLIVEIDPTDSLREQEFASTTSSIQQSYVEGDCDNNLDVGCSFDFDARFVNLVERGGYSKEYSVNFKVGSNTFALAGVTPISQSIDANYSAKLLPIPLGSFTSLDFDLVYNNEKLELNGELLGLENGEILCRFDGNSFWTNNCSASWNKSDRLGIVEIVEKQNQLIRLQVIYSEGLMSLKGLFQIDEKYYVVADSVYRFESLEEALPKAKKMLKNPILKHFAIDSYGKLAAD